VNARARIGTTCFIGGAWAETQASLLGYSTR